MCLERSERNDKNYELIEYLNDVNREHAEVLVEQNINGKTDTSYIYGAEVNGGFDRISLDRFDGSTGYYLYDARGSVSGITNEEGQDYQSYRYSVTGEITFGAPQYENEYTYNGESYNPNIQSQYLRARYYCVVTATFLTEDSYLGNQTEPLTLNRYNYCVSSYLNYTDPSGNEVFEKATEHKDNTINNLSIKYTHQSGNGILGRIWKKPVGVNSYNKYPDGQPYQINETAFLDVENGLIQTGIAYPNSSNAKKSYAFSEEHMSGTVIEFAGHALDFESTDYRLKNLYVVE